MAGYIMTIGANVSPTQRDAALDEIISRLVEHGVYSTLLPPAGNQENTGWNVAKEGTFADYFTMRPGDHIYFFCNRMIYGIGELVAIGEDCKYLGYEGAENPHTPTDEEYADAKPLIPFFDHRNRCICLFRPAPCFFRMGVDMDEVLKSNPVAFKMLRAFWKVSFIKVDDVEDQALMDVLLIRNEQHLLSGDGFYPYSCDTHQEIEKYALERYRFDYLRFMHYARLNGERFAHEMALEACLCDIMTHCDCTPFGHLDYVSHQVAASPFKPVDYIDKMDIFGYRRIHGTDTISKYVIVELKKDEATQDVITQIMKYVDFVTETYAHGNYSMIEAFVVAADFSRDIIQSRDDYGVRNYTRGYRPFQPGKWRGPRLIRYRCRAGQLLLEEIEGTAIMRGIDT